MQTSKLFVDTSGWMAYLVVGESQHAQAVQEIDHALDDASIAIYTTDHILDELVALMQSRRLPRTHILRDVNGLLIAPKITKLYTDGLLYLAAWNVLMHQTDKGWSLADAISILRMQEFGMTEALTTDHHFEQAGFVRLLA